MKRTSIIFLSLLAVTGCSNLAPAPKQEAAEKKPAAVQYAGASSDCNAQAESKLKLFDRPDTYPISNEERNNARAALFSECMKAHEPQVAGIPKSDTQANAQDIAALAALNPAAGGNPPQTAQAAPYPAGSTVIMVQGNNVSQLASLSPSAGGTSTPNGATVVVVQTPASAPPPARHVAELPTALARPIAASPQTPPTTAEYMPALPPTPKALPSAASDQDSEQLEDVLTK